MKHILFVDDEVPIRETLSLYFKMKGIKVSTVANREDAIRLAEDTSFDLIILDVNLGGENGLELLSCFKQKYPQLPIIMFTSLGRDPELMKDAMEIGANAIMSKAEPLEELMAEALRVMK